MATVSRQLPRRPHLDVPKEEARALLAAGREGLPSALERIRHRHPRFGAATAGAAWGAELKLSDAQLVVAREYGFASWAALKQRVVAATAAGALLDAIEGDNRDAVVAILRASPELLHLPVRSNTWGPPMSHAANRGRLEIVQAVAELRARDYQHAFERAVLQGQIETARWLYGRGAKLVPGIILSSCETLNVAGARFLLELGAPLADRQGRRLGPLAHLLGTYSRNPAGKHGLLELFAAHGCKLPDTPMMAFHRGDLARLRGHLREDPALLARRFTLREIYPAECGCRDEGRSAMHGTPIGGTTLLHLAIDFREREIFDWLLAEGADPDARALVDGEGFGGHTALFHTVIGGEVAFAAALLGRGAAREMRASLRKFLDWCEEPRWHEARDVTAIGWARTFPDQSWVNQAALELLEQ